MVEFSKTALGLAAGLAATTIIGYCIYYDKKRRSDPEYKKKVRARRLQARRAERRTTVAPNPLEPGSFEQYFLEEIHLGETYIAAGEVDEGVKHLANALDVCGRPTQLIGVLQQTLQPHVFALLVIKLQEMAARRASGDEAPRLVFGAGFRRPSANEAASSANAMIDSLE